MSRRAALASIIIVVLLIGPGVFIEARKDYQQEAPQTHASSVAEAQASAELATNPIYVKIPVDDGEVEVGDTGIMLHADTKRDEWRMNQVKVVARLGDTDYTLQNDTDRYYLDTPPVIIDQRYVLHVEGLSANIIDPETYEDTGKNPREVNVVCYDRGPDSSAWTEPVLTEVALETTTTLPGTEVWVRGVLHGRWVPYELFVVMNTTDRPHGYYHLNNTTDDLLADSRLREMSGRYLVHVAKISPEPRKGFTIWCLDLGEGRIPSQSQ